MRKGKDMITNEPKMAALSAIELGEKIGLAYTCRMCEHWWKGVEIYAVNSNRGSVLDIRCTGGECGGPAAGMSFQNYKGPLGSNLANLCFLCGKKAVAGIEVARYPGKLIGVCKKHIDVVNRIEPVEEMKTKGV
jgi:hypothetical protein